MKKIIIISNDPFLKIKHVIVLCDGDEYQPRSGYLFALLTKWIIHSIDPNMESFWLNNKTLWNNLENIVNSLLATSI